MNTEIIIAEVNKIIAETLPGFWSKVHEYKSIGGKYIAIKIACSSYEINRVEGQRPQVVSLCLDPVTLELKPQVYGGNGGQTIYRKIDPNHPTERYLAMQSIKIPFRKPTPKLESIYKAIHKFCLNYKEALTNNVDRLEYQDVVNYKELLNITQ
jgi:hypothetical protein